jgi:hypothetical protein
MATNKELRKYAEEFELIEELKDLGFLLSPSALWFYRKRDGFIDYIGFEVKSSGAFMSIPVICLKEQFVDHCDMSKFPRGFTKGIPFYSSTYLNRKYGVEIGHNPWKISSVEQIKTTFHESLSLIKSNADPWFKAIDSNEKLWESYTLNFRENTQSENVIAIRDRLLNSAN